MKPLRLVRSEKRWHLIDETFTDLGSEGGDWHLASEGLDDLEAYLIGQAAQHLPGPETEEELPEAKEVITRRREFLLRVAARLGYNLTIETEMVRDDDPVIQASRHRMFILFRRFQSEHEIATRPPIDEIVGPADFHNSPLPE